MVMHERFTSAKPRRGADKSENWGNENYGIAPLLFAKLDITYL
jgi:hypothetical protein